MTGSATACSIGAPGEAESDGSARRRGARGYAVYVRKMEGTVVSCVWGEGRGSLNVGTRLYWCEDGSRMRCSFPYVRCGDRCLVVRVY